MGSNQTASDRKKRDSIVTWSNRLTSTTCNKSSWPSRRRRRDRSSLLLRHRLVQVQQHARKGRPSCELRRSGANRQRRRIVWIGGGHFPRFCTRLAEADDLAA